MRKLVFAVLLGCWLGYWPGCGKVQAQQSSMVAVEHEPEPNLGQLKTKLKVYHDCAERECYLPQMERQTELAMVFLKASVAHAKQREKLALVLDIDETSLSNWEAEKRDDFGYIAADWNQAVKQREATAIAGTLKLYQEAEREHVAVFFITGRPESQREDTAANLKSAGYLVWDGLALRAEDHPKGETTVEYKSGERKKIVAAGYRIVLNVGDQWSDLKGDPQAEHSVKLPNPFYYIP
jgi:acid phosphatase